MNTNALLEVEPALAAVLPLADGRNAMEIARELAGNFSQGQITDALAEMERGRAEGLFSSRRPRAVAPLPPASDQVPYDRNLQHLVLTVTEACNLRCRYCLHGADLDWIRGHGHRSMSRETAFRAVSYFLDRCDPRQKPVISFYGGEPLLEVDLITAVVEHVRSHPRGRDAALTVDTNGLLLHEQAAALIRRERLHLQVSLDGPQEIHDRHRLNGDDRPTHGTMMANLKSLLLADRDLAERLVFIVTLAPPFNLPAVDEYFTTFPLFQELGITRPPHLRVNFANLAGQFWPDLERNFAQAATQLEELRRQYLDNILHGRYDRIHPVPRALFEADLVRFHKRSRKRMGPTINPGSPCVLGRRKLHVDVDGRFEPCERTGSAFPLGSLPTGISVEKVARYETGFWRNCAEHCSGCWAVRLCGICHAHLAGCQAGSLADLPESACRRERHRLEGIMGMMVQVLSIPPEKRKFLDDYIMK